MRALGFMKTCSACLIVLAATACGGPAANNLAGNETVPAEANDVVAPAENAAVTNEAAPAANAAAAAAEEPYRASGTEPFWSLTIGGGHMTYDSADGPDVTVATPAQQPTRAGYRYVTPEMTVVVNTFQRCEAVNEAEYHDTVRVTIGGQTVTGCGGEETRAGG
jgi:uncharacterized membrane protein